MIAAAPVWTVTFEDAIAALFAGFEIGGMRIAPGRIVFAILLFLALLYATRLARRWIERALLAQSRTDPGVASSISIVAGYAGFALATAVALGFAGIDVTNLAIVAGALSVGIGFGLQSIVNNFVSGLILLAERPVKVGDWIAVKGYEGAVRRISVRATEIETRDRASVIIPNSDLVTGPVENLTRSARPSGSDVLSRTFAMRVGVAHDSDPDRVLDVLRAAAAEAPLVSKEPEPQAFFDQIGESALEFSVHAQAKNAAEAKMAESELRSHVMRRLREAGVAFAQPRVDVRLRDLDAVRAFLARVLEERARQAASQDIANNGKPEPGADKS